jgi:phosphate transport system substrate-binding protein
MQAISKGSRARWCRCMGGLWLAMLATVVAAAQPEQVRLEGSTTLLPLLQSLAKEFTRMHSGVELEVHGGGSGQGIAALLDNSTSIASSSRFITEQELADARENGIYPVPFRIAYDAIIPVVHKTNPVKSLSLEQLRQIYSGAVSNWRELGGADRAIGVIFREEGSGTFEVWRQLVTGDAISPVKSRAARTSAEVVRQVADHRGAVGYIGLGNLNPNVKPLRVDGVMGSLRNVRSGNYPLSRPLFLFTAGWPAGAVQDFVTYAQDPDGGQGLVERSGFIPLYEHGGH